MYVKNVLGITKQLGVCYTSNISLAFQVSATDADIDRPTNIEYALSGSYSDRFQIDRTSGVYEMCNILTWNTLLDGFSYQSSRAGHSYNYRIYDMREPDYSFFKFNFKKVLF